MICSSGVNAMLVSNDLPELGTNLISALASLHVNELAHGFGRLKAKGTECFEYLRAQKEDEKILPKSKHAKTLQFRLLSLFNLQTLRIFKTTAFILMIDLC